ncbi:MAG: hypothetical protein K2N22_05175 [Clostridia bacterium]|nr:hypothetical protein [Clostridia bacterium]
MKKTIITIVAILTVMVATLCMSLTLTACGDKKADSYNFTVVYSDGTAVNGHKDGIGGVDENGDQGTEISIQICAVNPDTDDTGFCTSPVLIGTDGKVSITSGTKEGQLNESKLEAGYKWHVKLIGEKSGWTYTDLYLDGYGDYTITITK